MTTPLSLFVTCPRGLEPALAEDLAAIGVAAPPVERGGAALKGDLDLAYRLCLWSRVASRVLAQVAAFEAPDEAALYRAVRQIDWTQHVGPTATIAVDAVLVGSALGHSHFAALRVKDAVVDQLREATGARPNVDPERPDVRLNLFVGGTAAHLSVDLAGEGLHRRHYRVAGAEAPLKENLAAGLLYLAGWPAAAASGQTFLDPMCGTGTLPIEAALMAADAAPGLLRGYFGLLGWRRHDAALWERLLAEARQRDRRRELSVQVVGYDADPDAIHAARANMARAGLADPRFEVRKLADWQPPAAEGLIVTNPPYGKRLGEVEQLESLYRSIGDVLKQRFSGWEAHILSGDRQLDRAVGLRPRRRVVVFNGPIECRLLAFPLQAGSARKPPAADRADQSPTPPLEPAEAPADLAESFANRLRKRAKHMDRWAAREGISCYRVYDADLPEFAFAVDRYERWVHVQEYAPPPTVDATAAGLRRRAALAAVAEVLGVPARDVILKTRRRQRGGSQYERLKSLSVFNEVHEGGHRFLVNLTDYLDTGLFLDHRLTRARLAELAPVKDFLNLFAYTGTATVYAARAGARSTTSVDLSATYLDWALGNLELNGIRGPAHQLVKADVLAWLRQQRTRYGLIFLDPPTFSTSKSMDGTLDVQRDHVSLIRDTARLLTADGVLLFSTNHRRFKLDRDSLSGFQIDDISKATIPYDFERSPRIHQTFLIRR